MRATKAVEIFAIRGGVEVVIEKHETEHVALLKGDTGEPRLEGHGESWRLAVRDIMRKASDEYDRLYASSQEEGLSLFPEMSPS